MSNPAPNVPPQDASAASGASDRPVSRLPSAGAIFVVSLLLIAVGWGGWFARRVRARHAFIRAVRNAGGDIDSKPLLSQWLHERLDWNWAASLGWVYRCRLRFATDDDLARLHLLSELGTLQVYHTKITDDGLRHIGRLKGLRALSLASTRVTDDGLKHLAGLTAMDELLLQSTGITDDGLRHLAGMTALETLDIDGTGVTDAGLLHLEAVASLKEVHVKATKVTGAGANEFRRRRPDCKVGH